MTLQADTEVRNSERQEKEVILGVRDVVVQFPRKKQKTDFNAVNGVSFDLRRGETLGLVGESGSGKSMTALSLLGLVPVPGKIIEGSINLRDRRIDNLPVNELRKVRGNDLGMVFQDPMTGLNPVRNIGSQLFGSLIGCIIVIQQYWWFGFFILIPHIFNFLLWIVWLIQIRSDPDNYLEDGEHKKFGKTNSAGMVVVPNRLTLKWIPNYYLNLGEKNSTYIVQSITLVFCLVGLVLF